MLCCSHFQITGGAPFQRVALQRPNKGVLAVAVAVDVIREPGRQFQLERAVSRRAGGMGAQIIPHDQVPRNGVHIVRGKRCI